MLTATDKRGKPVMAQRDIRVTDAQTGQAGPAWLTVHANQETAQPGDRIRVTLSTADSGLHLIQLLDGYQGQVEDTRPESGRKTPQRMNVPEGPGGPFRFPELGSTPASFVIPVTDADRGGFAVSHAFVRQNRMYGFESLIEVPWSDRELDIQTETWRDRTLPGSAEEWTVKVRGSKGEAVAAEMLMSMYPGIRIISGVRTGEHLTLSPGRCHASTEDTNASSGPTGSSACEIVSLNLKPGADGS
jgi:hypothetical protein